MLSDQAPHPYASVDASTPSRGPLARRPSTGARTLTAVAGTTTLRIPPPEPGLGLGSGPFRTRQHVEEDGAEGEADATDGHHGGAVRVLALAT